MVEYFPEEALEDKNDLDGPTETFAQLFKSSSTNTQYNHIHLEENKKSLSFGLKFNISTTPASKKSLLHRNKPKTACSSFGHSFFISNQYCPNMDVISSSKGNIDGYYTVLFYVLAKTIMDMAKEASEPGFENDIHNSFGRDKLQYTTMMNAKGRSCTKGDNTTLHDLFTLHGAAFENKLKDMMHNHNTGALFIHGLIYIAFNPRLLSNN